MTSTYWEDTLQGTFVLSVGVDEIFKHWLSLPEIKHYLYVEWMFAK